MDKLYNIKTYLDKILLLEAAEGERKGTIANMWYVGMLDMKYVMHNGNPQSPMLLFSLRKYHPLSVLLRKKVRDTYVLSLPYPMAICTDENNKITFICH